MARSKKLADAYLELRAEDSKLTGDVKVKATKAAKAFGAQLNTALKALRLDPIDVKADPKTALAAIETTRQRLRDMSRDAESVEVRVRTERALTQLDRFAKQLGAVDDTPVEPKVELSPAQRQIDQLRRQLVSLGIDPVDIDADPAAALAAIDRVDDELRHLSGDAATVHVRVDAESARSSLARFRNMIGDVGGDAATGFVANFSGRVGPLMARLPLSPPLAAAVAVAGAAAAPTLAATLAAGVIGGAGAGGIVGGIKVASTHTAVKQAATLLGEEFSSTMQRAGVSFVPVVVDALGDIRSEIPALGRDLERAFSRVSVYVDPLTQDFLSGARAGVEGFAVAVERSGPVLLTIGNIAERTGVMLGDIFIGLSEHAPEAAHALAMVWTIFEYGTRSVFGTIEMLTQAYGWLAKFSMVLTGNIDQMALLTAEQEAAKGSSGGLSTELQNLLSGFTDTTTAAGRAAASYASTTQSVEEFTRRLEEMNRTLGATYGGNISVEQSNIRLEEAIDRASEAAKKNGDGINANIPKQRANREMLVGIADAALLAAEDIFAQTKSQELASAATERGRAAFLKTAAQMGVNAREARNLANQLFGIPRDVSTKADFEPDNAGVAAWKKTLSGIDRRIFIKAEFDLINNSDVALALRLGRLEDGGPVVGEGPKGKDSTLIYAAPGEHMLTAAEVDRMGGHGAVYAFRRQLMAVGRVAAPTQAGIPGYAGGGAIGASVERAVMSGWSPPVFEQRPAPVAAVTSNAGVEALLRRLITAVERIAPGVGRALTGAVEDAWVVEARLR
ncbi:hypothetical protein AB0N38_14285 [Micromonospora aurantiaca]|uniref:hypothetical protein n=1 Tax=Micromonospora aurantiaca (nom. illeg.) TaxID=47850 RepID=UPI0034380D38